jgi:hypothetical protein
LRPAWPTEQNPPSKINKWSFIKRLLEAVSQGSPSFPPPKGPSEASSQPQETQALQLSWEGRAGFSFILRITQASNPPQVPFCTPWKAPASGPPSASTPTACCPTSWPSVCPLNAWLQGAGPSQCCCSQPSPQKAQTWTCTWGLTSRESGEKGVRSQLAAQRGTYP